MKFSMWTVIQDSGENEPGLLNSVGQISKNSEGQSLTKTLTQHRTFGQTAVRQTTSSVTSRHITNDEIMKQHLLQTSFILISNILKKFVSAKKKESGL